MHRRDNTQEDQTATEEKNSGSGRWVGEGSNPAHPKSDTDYPRNNQE
jgi:hypothetical protein